MQARIFALGPIFLLFLLTGLGAPGFNSSPPEAQEPAAVFEIDGETYTFDRVLCSLPENEGGELEISARQGGLQLDISSNETVGSLVSLYDHENPMSPSVSWEAPDPAMMPSQRRALDLIKVEGAQIRVEATFHNEHTGATAEGRVVAHCSSDGSASE